IAVVNSVGINMFKLLGVLGITATVGGVAVDPAALVFDLPFMVAVAVACWPMAMNGGGIARWEGFVFLGFYALYLGYLVYDATATTLLVSPPVTAAIMGVALVGIALVSWRQRPMAP
ncbi:MAG: sodium:calcium antiporter, partial [Candidatus Competibacterales bacterium]